MHRDIVRVQFERPGDSKRWLRRNTNVGLHMPQIDHGIQKVGLIEVPTENIVPLGVPAKCAIDISQIVVHVRLVRIIVERSADEFDRDGMVLNLEGDHTKQVPGARMVDLRL